MVPLEVEQDLYCYQVDYTVTREPSKTEVVIKPSLGPHPNTNTNYNFKDEVEKLPYIFNLGSDVPHNNEQQY